MSDACDTAERGWQRLPPRLRPRDAERPGSGRLWLVETIVLLLVGLLLAIATVNDVVLRRTSTTASSPTCARGAPTPATTTRTSRPNRTSAHHTTTDVVCGNTTPGPPKERTQICLQMTGPVVARAPRRARRLVPAAEGRRPAPLPLRLLRHGQARRGSARGERRRRGARRRRDRRASGGCRRGGRWRR